MGLKIGYFCSSVLYAVTPDWQLKANISDILRGIASRLEIIIPKEIVAQDRIDRELL